MQNTASVLEKDRRKFPWDFDVKTDHLTSARWSDFIIIKKKKKKKKRENLQNYRLCYRLTTEENKGEKKDKYLDLARESKKLWNLRVTMKPMMIGAFGTVIKGLLKGLEDLEVRGRMKGIKTTALLITAKIQRKFLETLGDLLSTKIQWKTIR